MSTRRARNLAQLERHGLLELMRLPVGEAIEQRSALTEEALRLLELVAAGAERGSVCVAEHSGHRR